MEWHPYAKLFPMLPDAELQALADDIRENGLRHSIVVDADDRIIDGRNRASACEIAGVEPTIEAMDLDDREALAFVISANLKRRHLTPSQLADCAAKIANLKPSQKKSSCANLRSTEPLVSQSDAAEMLNVSRRSVQAAAKVHQHGTRELQQALTDGTVSVSRAARIADLPPEQQASRITDKSRSNGKTQTNELDLMSESASATADILKQISVIAKSASALCKSTAGSFVNATLVNRTLRELRQELQRAVLAQPCKECKGKGCMLCRDVGYVTSSHYEG